MKLKLIDIEMKLIFCVAIMALTGSSSCKDLLLGTVGPNDTLILRSIEKNSPTNWEYATGYLRFPPYYPLIINRRRITAVRVNDQLPNSEAVVQLYAGGVGCYQVAMYFKSELNKSYSFIVEIYGEP